VLIVGPGWQQLVSEFKKAGIRCVWLPFLEKLEDVAPLYRALDFYWVTARVEGGPVPLLEAMSSEICCLTTAVGLARDIVEDGINGVVLPMNDPNSFVNETVRLWNDTPTRLSLAAEARRTIRSRMHMGVTLQGVREVYARAFENFNARNGSSRALYIDSVNALKGKVQARSSALTPREKAHVDMLEALSWTEHLLLVKGQKTVALRLLAKAWRTEPTSVEPLRVFFRRYLPVGLVRRIVSAKHALTNQLRKATSAG
jgi:hypothetical protein